MSGGLHGYEIKSNRSRLRSGVSFQHRPELFGGAGTEPAANLLVHQLTARSTPSCSIKVDMVPSSSVINSRRNFPARGAEPLLRDHREHVVRQRGRIQRPDSPI